MWREEQFDWITKLLFGVIILSLLASWGGEIYQRFKGG